MKTVKNVLVKYYLEDHDRDQVLNTLTVSQGLGWLQREMGFKSYVTFWRKFNCNNGQFFYLTEIEKMQELLNIKFELK